MKLLMKNAIICLLLLALLAGLLPAASAAGSFTLQGGARLFAVTDRPPEGVLRTTLELAAAQFAAEKLPSAEIMPIVWGREKDVQPGDIALCREEGLGDEGFRLEVGSGGAAVYYSGKNGLLYGLNALLKRFLSARSNTVAACSLIDAPDTAERAVQLDCARKYWSVPWIKNLLRQMSWMGYNALVLHMTEDQGLRMNIWSEGPDCNGNDFGWLCGYGAASWASGYPDTNRVYTAAELRDIVETAKLYHIEIIPQVDVPDHCDYLLGRVAERLEQGVLTFRYGGRPYTVRSKLSASDNGGVINVADETARSFSLALIDAYAAFFADLGCTKMGIGCDEVETDDPAWQTYAAQNGGSTVYDAFVLYVNQVCALLKERGYRVRAFSDYLCHPSAIGLDRDLELCVWKGASSGEMEGRTVFNCIENFCYYVLRHNAAYGDARDESCAQWAFHHSTAERIFSGCGGECGYSACTHPEGWNPSRLYGYSAEEKTVVSGSRLGGGCYLIWGDWAGWNTETQVWEGVDAAGTYNLIDRLWANAAKQWDWDADAALTYGEFAARTAAYRTYPGFTACTAEPYLPLTAVSVTVKLAGKGEEAVLDELHTWAAQGNTYRVDLPFYYGCRYLGTQGAALKPALTGTGTVCGTAAGETAEVTVLLQNTPDPTLLRLVCAAEESATAARIRSFCDRIAPAPSVYTTQAELDACLRALITGER